MKNDKLKLNIFDRLKDRENKTLDSAEDMIKNNYGIMLELSFIIFTCFIFVFMLLLFFKRIDKINIFLLKISILILLCLALYKTYYFIKILKISDNVSDFFSKDTLILYYIFFVGLIFLILLVIWFIFF